MQGNSDKKIKYQFKTISEVNFHTKTDIQKGVDMACLIVNKIDVIANQKAAEDVLSKFISLFIVYCEKKICLLLV